MKTATSNVAAIIAERKRLKQVNAEFLEALKMYIQYEREYHGIMPVVMRPVTDKITSVVDAYGKTKKKK